MGKKILVIGGGGREHALVWKLAQSTQAGSIVCAPGNAGIAAEAETAPVGAEDLPALLELARKIRPDLTVVGPDNPLALGIVDLFQENGFRTFGPNRKAARFEASKVFTKEFLERHRIPTARSRAFTSPGPAHAYSENLSLPQVIKADAAGVFCYAMPRAGWWGFAALVEGRERRPDPEGAPAEVELGGLIWVRTVDMK